MGISTYTELKTAIEGFVKRDDVATELDTFIALAEADMWSGPAFDGAEPLRIRDMEARATATTGTSDRFLVLPDFYLKMRKLTLISGSQYYGLTFVVPESINILSGAGIPSDYTITSQIEFNRTPNSAFTAEMQYYKYLTALSASNASNAVLTRFPSIYLYGAIYHFALWSTQDDWVTKYGGLFRNAIKSANKSDKKGRYGAGKAMRIEGPTP